MKRPYPGSSKPVVKHVFVGPTGHRVGHQVEYYFREDELVQIFGQFGSVVDVKTRSNAKDVFAFVHFDSAQSATKAIQELNGKVLKGKHRVRVSYGAAKKQRPRYITTEIPPPTQQDVQPPRPSGNSYSYNQKDQKPVVSYSPKRRRSRSDSEKSTKRRKIDSESDSGRSRASSSVERSTAAHVLTIENIPKQMKWKHLEELGHKYGGVDVVEGGKVYMGKGEKIDVKFGRLNFNDRDAMRDVYDSLKGHEINGHRIKIFLD